MTKLPAHFPLHLFVSDIGGDLHDERVARWAHKPPLRAAYAWHFQAIHTVAQFKATLRAGPSAWPGAYPLFFVCSDGACLCFACARSEFRQIAPSIVDKVNDGWRVIACLTNWEDTALACGHCSEAIPSAYGEDGSDDDGGSTVPNPVPPVAPAPPAPPVKPAPAPEPAAKPAVRFKAPSSVEW